MILLDGRALSKKIRNELAEETNEFVSHSQVKPGLATVLVGNDPASRVYVSSKVKACAQVGINSRKVELSGEIAQSDLVGEIQRLNADPSIHGILVQLPLPKQIVPEEILEKIDPRKDVDGFHVVNVGRLHTGQPGFVPCTPLGIVRLLDEYQVPIQGQKVVVVGRSNIVGKPVAQLLLNRHATVTLCHSRTKALREICQRADILIAAIGKPEMIHGDWVKPGGVVIDVGINRREDGKLVGDVAFDEVSQKAGWLSPVPGGVGPLTIAMLLSNTLEAAQKWVK